MILPSTTYTHMILPKERGKLERSCPVPPAPNDFQIVSSDAGDFQYTVAVHQPSIVKTKKEHGH